MRGNVVVSAGKRMISPQQKLQHIVLKIRHNRFVMDVASVGGGIAAAQAIMLMFTPILTRLFSPEAFGVSAAYAALLSIILPIATLGYASAIVQPETDEVASAVARLSILCGLLLAPVFLLLVHFTRGWLAGLAGLQQASWVLYFIPVSLLLFAFLSVANQAAIREGLFKEKAKAYVESVLLTNTAKAVFGLIWPTALTLIVLTSLGMAINALMQLIRVKREGVLSPRNWWGVRGVRSAAALHKDFALYRMPQGVLRAVSVGLPIVLLTKLFNADTAGQYSITVVLLSAPVMLLGDAVGEVFYLKITRAIQERHNVARNLILRAVGVLLVVGIVPFGFIALAGDALLPWLLGKNWQGAGAFAQWISLWMFAMLASRPAASAIPALKLQHALLIYEVLVTSARIAALYAGARYGDALVAIAIFSLVNVAGYAALIFVVLRRAARIRRQPQ
jgi:O-antigen/teichoic acid export membrane protein